MIKLYTAKTTDFTQADYTNQYSLLECAIREKIDAKNKEISRNQSLAGYILLYRSIGELFPQKTLTISFNEQGKPLCDFCHFSISHSADRVVCVVSDKPVGVDIQQIRPVKPRKSYMLFNEKENDYVNQNTELISQRYIEIFTKKEAAIKTLGLSLSQAAIIDTFSRKFHFKTYQKDNFLITVCSKNVSIM